MVAGCYPCEMNARIDDLPPRERVHAEGGWRIAHAFNVSLPGWLPRDEQDALALRLRSAMATAH